MELKKWLYQGHVYHKRFLPKEHEVKQSVFFIKFPLTLKTQLQSHFFSVNRFNLFSFYDSDHGARNHNHSTQDLLAWAQQKLLQANIETSLESVELMTFPRVLGFVFNPVSFWFCYSDKKLFSVIAEVNNTFGETHSYVLKSEDLHCEKKFHVSPFFQVEGRYQFSFLLNEDRIQVKINYFINDKLHLTATIRGQPLVMSDRQILKTWLRNPMMTFMTVFYIHLHAFILFLKRIPFHGKNGAKER